MPDRAAFGAAVAELSTAHEQRTSLCRPFMRALPISGAAISTLGGPFGTETVCASDTRTARIDELQFDLGEGPCWDALRMRRPVLTNDVKGSAHPAWPVFVEALGDVKVGALYAFPLAIGSLDIGAVDLYSGKPGGSHRAADPGCGCSVDHRRGAGAAPSPGLPDREARRRG